jgi:competence protein ComEC
MKAPEGRATVPLWSIFVPVVAALALLLVTSQRNDGRLHLWVFDVGEGDAALLLTPNGHTVLVDGGPGATPLAEGIGRHLPFWQRNLDVVVLTRPQQENMMGLVELPDRYRLGQVVQTEFTGTGALQQTWLGALKEHDIPIHYAKRGDMIGFEDEPDVLLKVLNPGDGDILKGDRSTLENNTSIVLRVEYGNIHILLAGNIQEAGEANILRLAGDELQSQVLNITWTQ